MSISSFLFRINKLGAQRRRRTSWHGVCILSRDMSTTNLTKQRLELASLIDCPNELLSTIKADGLMLSFFDTRLPRVEYFVKLTPAGRVKKNSLRKSTY